MSQAYRALMQLIFFFFNDTATTEIYTLSLHDALPISRRCRGFDHPDHESAGTDRASAGFPTRPRSEEHTSELQSQSNLVCRLLLEKKKQISYKHSFRVPVFDAQPLFYICRLHDRLLLS